MQNYRIIYRITGYHKYISLTPSMKRITDCIVLCFVPLQRGSPISEAHYRSKSNKPIEPVSFIIFVRRIQGQEFPGLNCTKSENLYPGECLMHRIQDFQYTILSLSIAPDPSLDGCDLLLLDPMVKIRGGTMPRRNHRIPTLVQYCISYSSFLCFSNQHNLIRVCISNYPKPCNEPHLTMKIVE